MRPIEKLIVAACQGDKLLIESLLSQDILINDCDFRGQTPLHQAALMGHHEVVEWFLQKGADIDLSDIYGNTSLHLAAYMGMETVIILLLRMGAEINVQNNKGETPLHLAVSMGQDAAVAALLENKADVDRQDSSGNTPLHLSCTAGLPFLCESLLNKSAKINIENNQGYTALHEAALEDNKSEIQKLLQYGAYSYHYSDRDEFLEDYWSDIEFDSETDTSFYISLLLAGLDAYDEELPETLEAIRSNIEMAVVNYFEPFKLPQDDSKVIFKILRAFPRLIGWLQLLKDKTAKAAGTMFFKEAEQHNTSMFSGLDAVEMPAELMDEIEAQFTQSMLIEVFIHRLVKLYALPYPVATYFVKYGVACQKQCISFHKQLFDREWLTTCKTSTHDQMTQNLQALEGLSM